MDSSEPPVQRSPSPYPPAEARRRALARLCDLIAPALLVLLPSPLHLRPFVLAAAALLLCGDSLFGAGRSLGKRMFGLRAILIETRRPAPLFATLKRNLPFAAALLPGLAPGASSRFVALAALATALAIEALVALRPLARDLGQRRLGDLWAGTQVIDASIALNLPAPVPAPSPAQRALAAPPAHRLRAGGSKTKPEEAACAWR